MELPCLVIRGESHRPSKYPAVICVTAGKPFPHTHDAMVYPHFDRARIKSLTRMPDGRVLAQLKGVPRRWLKPGAVIVSGSEPLVRSRVGYGVSLRPIPEGVYQARGGLYREHILPGTVRIAAVASGYRLTSSTDLPLTPGATYRLFPAEAQTAAGPDHGREGPAEQSPQRAGGTLPSGGSAKGKRLPHELLLCIPVETGARKMLGGLLGQVGRTVSMRRIAAVNVALLGWTMVPERVGAIAVEEELRKLSPSAGEGEALLGLTPSSGPAVVLTRRFHDRVTKDIERALRRSGGEKGEAVARQTGHPLELVRCVLEELERTEQVVRDAGVLIPSGARAGLSPIEKGVLESLRSGFESKGFVRAGKGIERRVLEKLVEVRVAERVGDRFCAMDTFEALVDRLLRGRNPGEAIELAQARAILGLPREQTVQLLELLDARGLLRREGPVHRVVKGPRAPR